LKVSRILFLGELMVIGFSRILLQLDNRGSI
jgi:hypothetical protein